MKRSLRNLKRMVQFFRKCPALFEIGPPPVAQLPAGAFLPQLAAKLSERGKLRRTIHPLLILQQLAANLPWYHHVILMEKVKDPSVRLWYVQQTIEQGWTRA
ncbi:MAG: hypothetical protein HYS65_11345 [Betaproteobacteria bacterium]|nr:hypothetical protein [Betaproteobacteria bacterium]OGA41614.1 MAG: hypothetical protein A3G24_27870 [Betaproteobacteria bacterium RIFCSPLOWO2_12_FULL_62_13]